jgi:hypothetical protein
MSSYRCQATSVEGFLQVLACNYLPHGYWFYVAGVIPEGKDPELVDQKLIERYGVAVSRQGRVRRKHAGLANIHYLRFQRFWLLLATHGSHHFFESEGNNLRDARKVPIQFMGYSISVKKGGHERKTDRTRPAVADSRLRVRVQIGREVYRNLKAWFLEIATRPFTEALAQELFKVPFEPYAPVRQQMLNILRLVNRARHAAGLGRLSPKVLRFRRNIVKPFGEEEPRRGLPSDRRHDAEVLKVPPVEGGDLEQNEEEAS